MRSHLAISLLAMAIIATAQQASIAPLPVGAPIYTKHKNKLYIYGGSTVTPDESVSLLGQFFALDLSKPWKSTSPAWNALPEGPKNYLTGATVSLDGKIFMTSPNNNNSYLFSFDTKAWSMSKAIYPGTMNYARPVTLGTDGTVLVPGGSLNATYEYHTYSFARDQAVKAPLPDNLIRGIPVFYEAVWSEHFKSAVIFGGFNFNNGMVIFYHAEKKSWSSMATTAVNSRVGSGFCLAISDDGKKLFSYGGIFDPPIKPIYLSSSLYILDLTTGVWTEVANSGLRRTYSACTVTGDYFLLWGGVDENSIIDMDKSSTPVFIYQISLNAWVQEYKPSDDYLSPDLNTTSASVNIGAIAGGAAGGVVVMVVVGFLVWRCKRKRAKQPHMHDSTSDIDRHSATTDKIHDDRGHGAERMPQTFHPVDTYHSRPNEDYPNYADEANDSRHYGRDAYMYPAKHNASSHAPPPHPSPGDSYTTDASQYYGKTPFYTSDTTTRSHTMSSRSTSPAVSPYDYVLPPSDSSPPYSRSSKRRPRDPHVLDHKRTVQEHPYVPEGRRIEERRGPQWQSR